METIIKFIIDLFRGPMFLDIPEKKKSKRQNALEDVRLVLFIAFMTAGGMFLLSWGSALLTLL